MRIRSKEIRRSRKREEDRILDKVKAARAARPVKPVARPAAGGAQRPASAPRQRPPRPAAAPAAPAAEAPTSEA